MSKHNQHYQITDVLFDCYKSRVVWSRSRK